MQPLLALDQQLFLIFNHLPHIFFTDWLALFLSGVGFGGLIWIGIGVWLFMREEKKNHRFFVPIFLTLGISWIGVELFLKYLVARPRPTEALGAIIVGSGASWFSFPSSHATAAFAMAALLSQYEPRWRIGLYILATLISFSRIYLGVHYPFDVLAGAIIGSCLGLMIGLWFPKTKKSSKREKR